METLAKCARIVSVEEFSIITSLYQKEGKKVVVTSGGYDPLHTGHLTSILDSLDYGNILGVIVNGDGFLRRKKGTPFLPLEVRCQIVSAIRGVDYVIPYEAPEGDQTVSLALSQIKPDVFTKGGDRGSQDTIPEWTICKEIGTEIVFEVGDEKKYSSSDFLNKWLIFHQGKQS